MKAADRTPVKARSLSNSPYFCYHKERKPQIEKGENPTLLLEWEAPKGREGDDVPFATPSDCGGQCRGPTQFSGPGEGSAPTLCFSAVPR